jgi:hypothetical protein
VNVFFRIDAPVAAAGTADASAPAALRTIARLVVLPPQRFRKTTLRPMCRHAVPVSPGRTVELDVPLRKYRHPRFLEQKVRQYGRSRHRLMTARFAARAYRSSRHRPSSILACAGRFRRVGRLLIGNSVASFEAPAHLH